VNYEEGFAMNLNLMNDIDERWQDSLAAHAVRISAPGEGMLRLDAVEVGPHYNKPRTNLLLRYRPSQPGWDMFADDDLQYLGDDPRRRQLFTGPRFQHWLALVTPHPVRGDVHDALLTLLDWLDSPMRESLPRALPPNIARAAPLALDAALEGVARLRDAAEFDVAGFEPTAAQAEAIAQIAATVTQQVSPCCPLVHGLSGSGKHALARAAAKALIERGLFQRVLEISGAAVVAGMLFRPQKDERLGRVLDAAQGMEHALVMLDQFDAVLEQSEICAALMAQHLERGLKLIAVARGEFAFDGGESWLPWQRRLRVVGAPGLGPAEAAEVLRRRLAGHPLAGKIELATGLVPSIVAAAARRPGASPGTAIDLLDALLAQAAWCGATVIGLDDLLHLVPRGYESAAAS
jgi:hypothetical protein